MARFSMHVETAWSAEQAFAYMADLSNFAKWDPGVLSARRFPDDDVSPIGFGTQFDVTVKAGSVSTLRYRFVDFVPNQRFVITASNRWVKSVDEVKIVDSNHRVTIYYDAELTMNGRLGFFDPLLAKMFNRMGQRAKAGLVRVATT